MALPTWGRNHTSSRLAACLSNQRQLSLAYLLYAQEHRDGLLGSSFQQSTGRVELFGGGFWPGPTTPINATLSPEAAEASVRQGLLAGPLAAYAPHPRVFHCPADQRSTALTPGQGWGWDSYAKVDGMAGEGSGGTTPFRQVSAVSDPASSLVFVEEADPRGYNLGTWTLNTAPPGWVDPPAAYHADGLTVSFFDGHVEFRGLVDPVLLAAARSHMAGRSSFFPSGGHAANPDFVWFAHRYRFVGWRALP